MGKGKLRPTAVSSLSSAGISVMLCVLSPNLPYRPYWKNSSNLNPLLGGEEGFTIPRCPELVEKKAISACLKIASKALQLGCYNSIARSKYLQAPKRDNI